MRQWQEIFCLNYDQAGPELDLVGQRLAAAVASYNRRNSKHEKCKVQCQEIIAVWFFCFYQLLFLEL